MIIVSQNKKEIYNFEKISCISIGQNYHQSTNEKDFTYDIYIEGVIEGVRSIGSYPSLNRAKEILEELVKFYRLDDKKEAVPSLDVLALVNIRAHGTFYMPEE